jgi:uncharacterized membrane protein YGL010W
MKTLEQHLSNYAGYHRDRRNIATHFVGIPMIVLGVSTLLSRPIFMAGDFPLSPAIAVAIGAMLFWFALDLRFGIVMALQMAASTWAGSIFAAQATSTWLIAGVGLFFVGWVIQFIGHYYEGKKPAFVDDLVGLLIGPLFITAEAAFAMGLRIPLKDTIEKSAGPTHIRAMGAAATR